MKRILSIQDISCLGQCSQTIALPIISSRGIEVSILPSAIMSTHTGGFKDYTCLNLTDEMPKIVDHWVREGIKFDAVYTGYIGDARQFDIIKYCRKVLLDDDGLFIVDPAMADDGMLYSALNDDIVDGMRDIIRGADLIMPNTTEAAFLIERDSIEGFSLEDYADVLMYFNNEFDVPESIITGVQFERIDRIGVVAFDSAREGLMKYFTYRQPKSYHGTGDIFASIVVADRLNGKPLSYCIEDACTFIGKAIEKTLPVQNHEYGVCFEQVLAEERQQ